jgi:hypothetical protein
MGCGRWYSWVPVVVDDGSGCCCAKVSFPDIVVAVVASVVVHSISVSTNCSRNGGTAAAGEGPTYGDDNDDDEVGALSAVDVRFVIFRVYQWWLVQVLGRCGYLCISQYSSPHPKIQIGTESMDIVCVGDAAYT